MRFLDHQLAKLDQISDPGLLSVNAAICGFVLLAHGGALLLARSGRLPAEQADSIVIAYVTVPLAAVMLLLSAVGLLRPARRPAVLKVHAVVLLALAGYMAYFAISVLVSGIPEGTRFSWNPVLFAALLAYPAYLAGRAFAWSMHHPLLREVPFWIVVASVPVSAIIMYRILQ